MKTTDILIIAALSAVLLSGCGTNSNRKSGVENKNSSDTALADSIVQSYSGVRLVKEVPYKNGKRQGLMKTYNANGTLYQTFWYDKGLRQDTAKMYFEDGRIFRTTPFKNDSMNGIQTQFYKSGRVKAKLNFVNGLRVPSLEEFDSNGRLVTDYPEVEIKTQDNYKQNGTYIIRLGLNKPDVKVNFSRGEYSDGLFNPKKCARVNDSDYTGYIVLKKAPEGGKNYVGVIAEILTIFGNRKLVYKKIDLPYNDLK